MRIFDAIVLLLSRAAGRRARSDHTVGSPARARAARRACPTRRTRETFEIRRPERFGVGDVEPGSSHAPEAGGVKL